MAPKTRKVLMWVCIALLGLQFAAAGIPKLLGLAEESFVRWGYNTTFMYIVGVLETSAAIGVFIPRTRKWAALGLICIMIGAAYTHMTHDELPRLFHNLIVVLLAVGVLVFSKQGSPSSQP